MRVISLRTKLTILLIAITAFLLAALFTLSLFTDRAGYDGLMLVTPNGRAVRGITPTGAESLRRDEGLMLTYEISTPAVVGAINSSHSVTMVGTNSTYLDITGYRLISGGFFTQSAWDGRSRLTTLNKSAAFAMFGGANIDGQTINIDGALWIITGVIDDRQEYSRIFVPSSVSGGSIRSLMVVMGEGTGRDYVVSVLAGFGMRDGDYDFISLCAAAGATGERFAVAWKAAVCLALILLMVWGLAKLSRAYSRLKQETDNYYLRELLVYRRADVAQIGVIIALLLGGIAVTLNLSLRILATVLRWRDISLPMWYPSADFAYMLSLLRNIHAVSAWVFGAYLIAIFGAVMTLGGFKHGGNIAARD